MGTIACRAGAGWAGAPARRGITFVEIVCASALLGVLIVGIFGGLNFMLSQQKRLHHRLAAAELANRLILQYLDDVDSMPAAGLPIEYDKNRYRWELQETAVKLTPARADKAAERASKTGASADRMVAVTIRVWLSEESGGGFTPDGGVPGSQLSRIVDPFAITRNPDSLDYIVKNPDKLQQFISKVQGGGRPQGGAVKPQGKTGKAGANPEAGGTGGGGGKKP